MSMTINQLHKKLGELIRQGHKNKQVCICKTSFTHPLEDDGCVVLEVVDAKILTLPLLNEDGGAAWRKDGSQKHKTDLVLIGNSPKEAGLC